MTNPAQNGKQLLSTLWFDLKTSVQVAETPAVFDRFCEIRRCAGLDGRQVEGFDPDLIVLEFDYPSRADMEQAAGFKAKFSNIPMIVVTVQHSEALAVWFFRKKFLDYLVQPVTATEATHCLTEIRKITALRRKQNPRRFAEQQSSMPLEVSHGNGPSQPLLPAVALVASAYYEQLTVTRAAQACNLLPFKFGREFKEEFGIDFREYVVRYRIREACRLLRNPNAQVSEIAYAVGFSEPSYFTKTFKKLVGTPPSQVVGRQDLEFTITEKDPYRDSMSSS
jgi:AraC-like DNA-binding protein